MKKKILVPLFFLFFFPLLANHFFYNVSWATFPKIVLWGLLPGFLTILLLPLYWQFNPQLMRRPLDWPMMRILSLAFVALVCWYTTRLKILPFNFFGIVLNLFIFLIPLWFFSPHKSNILSFLKDRSFEIIKFESCILFVLHCWAITTTFHPEIFWGEKPMDMSFLATLMRQEWFPLIDPWAYGHSVRYYYFGYYQMAFLGKLTGLPVAILFQLAMATYFSMAISAAWNLFAVWFSPKKSWGISVLGAIGLILGTNLKTFLEWFGGLWPLTMDQFWKLTRIFPHGYFAEFPAWSFVFADLHAHVMNYCFFITYILLIFLWKRRRENYYFYLLSFTFGILIITSTWEALIALGLWPLLVMTHFKEHKKQILLMPILGLSLIFPFYWDIKGGVPIVFNVNSPALNLWEGVINHHGLWWGLFFVGFILFYLKRKSLTLFQRLRIFEAGCLFIFALMGVVFVDYFYIMDPLNTVFKFHNSFFILFGLAALAFLPEAIDHFKILGTTYCLLLTSIIFSFALLWGPYQPSQKKYAQKFYIRGLDGSAYLKTLNNYQFQIIDYINTNIKGAAGILEVWGDSFSHDRSVISSFTGLNSYLGWSGHVYLRGVSLDQLTKRKNEINDAYLNKDPLALFDWCQKNNLAFIFFGPVETSVYGKGSKNKLNQYSDLFPKIICFENACLYGVRNLFERHLAVKAE